MLSTICGDNLVGFVHLLCSNSSVTMSSGVTSNAIGIGACTFDPRFSRAEAEFGIGHVANQQAASDPRVTAVTYNF